MKDNIILPWEGDNYKTGGIFDKHIMVLGTRHYCEKKTDELLDFTEYVIDKFLNYRKYRSDFEKWMNQFTAFERSMVNKETNANDSKEIWNSLLFYNYIQDVLKDKNEIPTEEQYKRSESPFFDVLNKYQPDCCIVWGIILWSNLPQKGCVEQETIDVNENKHYVRKYIIDSGRKVPFLCVHSPARGYNWNYWYNVISAFLKKN